MFICVGLIVGIFVIEEICVYGGDKVFEWIVLGFVKVKEVGKSKVMKKYLVSNMKLFELVVFKVMKIIDVCVK